MTDVYLCDGVRAPIGRCVSRAAIDDVYCGVGQGIALLVERA
jgi:hypothetical protein